MDFVREDQAAILDPDPGVSGTGAHTYLVSRRRRQVVDTLPYGRLVYNHGCGDTSLRTI